MRVFAVLLTLLTLSTSAFAAEDAYPLDEVSREVTPRGPLHCPDVETAVYRGKVLRYHKPVRIFVGFRERLERFEAVVRDTAIEFYGRAPTVIRHAGTLNCRRISGWPHLISEHGVGNGIDIEGFDFGGKRPFTVRVGRDWTASGAREKHSRFLRALAQRLIDRKDIFRVLLGPSYPGHKSHFHFDCSPWRLVDIFGESA